jgi:hypothetical protein
MYFGCTRHLIVLRPPIHSLIAFYHVFDFLFRDLGVLVSWEHQLRSAEEEVTTLTRTRLFEQRILHPCSGHCP